jgi:hypothetical protein
MGNFVHQPSVALFSILVALAPFAIAQRVATAHAVSPARTAPHFAAPGTRVFGRGPHPSSRLHHSSPYSSLPFPFFGDSFNPDDIYSTGYPVASQPPPFLLQAARALAGPSADSIEPDMISQSARESQSSQPLMIELQGGRYVHVTSAAINGEALPLNPAQPAISTGSQTHLAPVIAAAPAHDLPPAVLVFRDGHSEEVRDYTIADGSLYARGDYYTDGYWNKKIDLSTLNLTQTLQVNTNRNVKFILPSSPNEVITRP